MNVKIPGMFAVALLAGAMAPNAMAAPVYSQLTDSYYEYINCGIGDDCAANNSLYRTWTWEAARADAEARSYLGRQGHLVTLTSAAEEQILIDNWFADILYGQPWLGGFRLPGSDPLTGWQWVTGEAFGHTNWRSGEPNNAGGNEYYLHYQSINVASITQYDSYGWNDASAALSVGYFIEYSRVPEPGTLALLGLGLAGLGLSRRRKAG